MHVKLLRLVSLTPFLGSQKFYLVSAPATQVLSHTYRSSSDISPTFLAQKCALIKYAYVVIYNEHANKRANKVFFNSFAATISLWKVIIKDKGVTN